MLRGYRSILAALAGLVLASASNPPQPSQGTEQSKPAEKAQPPAEVIASAIRETIIPRNEDIGCDQGDDRRESDLCAQWKAADAARDAANFTLAGLLVAIIGTALLWKTFAETRKIARREQRAYLTVAPVAAPAPGSLGEAQIRFEVTNYGSTPALDVRIEGCTFMAEIETEGDFPTEFDWQHRGRGVVVHPGIPNNFGVIVELSAPDITQALDYDAPRKLHGIGKVSYTDVFGGAHVEQSCYAVRYTPKAVQGLESARFQAAQQQHIST